MKPYSCDLRERIVQAVEAGQPVSMVARTFGVHVSSVKRYVVQYRRTGSLTAKPYPGSRARLGPEQHEALVAQLRAAPDATLAEHSATWERTQGMRVPVPTMHRAIARVGWTRKKSNSGRPSKTRRREPRGGTTSPR